MKRSAIVRIANLFNCKSQEFIFSNIPQHAAAACKASIPARTETTQRVWSSLSGAAFRQPAAVPKTSNTTVKYHSTSLNTLAWIRAARLAPQPVGRPISSARHQQARGFSRFMYFPSRGRLGGGSSSWQDWDPSKVLWGIIAANGAVFLMWRSNPRLCMDHFTVSIDSLRQGRLHTLATAAFSQKDFMHFAANMIGLYFFGQDIGRLFGGKKLLALYLAGGVVGSLAHCGWYYYQAGRRSHGGGFGRPRFLPYSPPALGASAAVNAVMVLDILLFPTRTILLYGIIPMPAALLGTLWLLRDVTGTMEGGGHIAHAGHLGGATMGLAFWVMFRRGRIRPPGLVLRS